MTDQNKSTAVRKWGDQQQYEAAPMEAHYDERTGVLPKVTLTWMTPDPLGAIAAACRMYEGKPTYDLSDITDEERRHYWNDARATHLKAPLEFVNFHFFIEGVDRAFTHQMVRQRTAVFAQESMRFAVMEDDLLHRTSLPPSLHGTRSYPMNERHASGRSEAQRHRDIWDDAVENISSIYHQLVNSGMPAEEARGLLPHATATRLNYHTNLRNLLDHAGNRLCTQAQFHWRLVFTQMALAIRNYDPIKGVEEYRGSADYDSRSWQFEELSKIFRPVCYDQGKCPFKAGFDRDCSIRERVDAFAREGVPSNLWHDDSWMTAEQNHLETIQPQEWAMDPDAARRH